MNLGEIIKTYRDEHKMTMQEFATKSGLSKGYISMLEKNWHPQHQKEIVPSLETFKKVAVAMGISLNAILEMVDSNQLVDISGGKYEDYLGGHDSRQQYNLNEQVSNYDIKALKGISIPVLGSVAAGIPIDAIEDILDYEEISVDLARSGEFFGLRVQGDSMSPRIQEGDVVIVRQQNDAESGDVVIVLINGDEATCKKLVRSDSGIVLHSFNPFYEPKYFSVEEIESLPVRIVGKVVELRGKF